MKSLFSVRRDIFITISYCVTRCNEGASCNAIAYMALILYKLVAKTLSYNCEAIINIYIAL